MNYVLGTICAWNEQTLPSHIEECFHCLQQQLHKCSPPLPAREMAPDHSEGHTEDSCSDSLSHMSWHKNSISKSFINLLHLKGAEFVSTEYSVELQSGLQSQVLPSISCEKGKVIDNKMEIKTATSLN